MINCPGEHITFLAYGIVVYNVTRLRDLLIYFRH